MASGSSSGGGGRGDRLSRLGDTTIGHILSFLPALEAARTASLSWRWRHVFPAVHTLSFAETEAPFRSGNRWWRRCSYCNHGEAVATRFVDCVSAALHGRHRGFSGTTAAATVPLRALRIAFDESGFRRCHDATTAVDGWLSYTLHAAAGEPLEIDLRLNTKPICRRAYTLLDTAGEQDAADDADDDDDAKMGQGEGQDHQDAGDEEEPSSGKQKYVVPRSLFTAGSAVPRALRLSGCWINLPVAAAFAMPSIDTLHLTRVTGRRGAIQRLVSACPSLVDLTLEACDNLTALSVDGAPRFRRLALRCCHALASVSVDSPELRAFEYRGTVPPPQFLTVHTVGSGNKVLFCALDFCGMEVEVEHAAPVVFGLMELFAGVERLHLTSARLGSIFVNHGKSLVFPMLHDLEITGMLPDDDASVAIVTTVARILEGTPRLETLSLFLLPEPHRATERQPVLRARRSPILVNPEVLRASHELRYEGHARLVVPPQDEVKVPACLRETTREINLVHYQGSVAQRALAKFLLCNAPVVEEVYWKVARGPLSIQRKLMEEIKGWVVNKSAKMMFF